MMLLAVNSRRPPTLMTFDDILQPILSPFSCATEVQFLFLLFLLVGACSIKNVHAYDFYPPVCVPYAYKTCHPLDQC